MDDPRFLQYFLGQSIDEVIEETADAFFLTSKKSENEEHNSPKGKKSQQYYALNEEPDYEDEDQKYTKDKKTRQYYTLTDKPEYKEPRYEKYSDISQYEKQRGNKSQYHAKWTDEPEYNDSIKSKEHFQDTRTDKPQYEIPTEEDSQHNAWWTERPEYDYSRKDKSQFQDKWAEKAEHNSQQEGKSYVMTDKPRYESYSGESNTWNNKSQYDTSRRPEYQTSGDERLQHSQRQNEGKAQYQPQYQAQSTNPSRFEERRPNKQEEQRDEDYKISERPYTIKNVGEMYNLTPPQKDNGQKSQQSEESILDKYERFRSQRRNLYDHDQSGKKQSSNKDRVEENYKTHDNVHDDATQVHDVNKSMAHSSSDSTPPSSKDQVEKQNAEENKEYTFDLGLESGDREHERIENIEVVTRKTWGALPTMVTLPPFSEPANTVVFTLGTKTSPCDTPKECMRRVREVQARHMGEGLGDIQYSFLVGGDGCIYEGRGFQFESGTKREGSEGANISIAFIGKYKQSNVPALMLQNAQDLVTWAFDMGILKKAQARIDTEEIKKLQQS